MSRVGVGQPLDGSQGKITDCSWHVRDISFLVLVMRCNCLSLSRSAALPLVRGTTKKKTRPGLASHFFFKKLPRRNDIHSHSALSAYLSISSSPISVADNRSTRLVMGILVESCWKCREWQMINSRCGRNCRDHNNTLVKKADKLAKSYRRYGINRNPMVSLCDWINRQQISLFCHAEDRGVAREMEGGFFWSEKGNMNGNGISNYFSLSLFASEII
tara:strand:+ start:272 stop:922 length:651 start_codon:yes stop_codon:yes gene_type:complete